MLRAELEAMQLARARRMASRKRAETACMPCKAKKAKCSDFRPCARCLKSGAGHCRDGSPEVRSKHQKLNPYLLRCVFQVYS